MIDLVSELDKSHYEFSPLIKVACGYKFILSGIDKYGNIHGMVLTESLNGKKFIYQLEFDRYGMPLLVDKYPTYYYMRLVVRK